MNLRCHLRCHPRVPKLLETVYKPLRPSIQFGFQPNSNWLTIWTNEPSIYLLLAILKTRINQSAERSSRPCSTTTAPSWRWCSATARSWRKARTPRTTTCSNRSRSLANSPHSSNSNCFFSNNRNCWWKPRVPTCWSNCIEQTNFSVSVSLCFIFWWFS